MGQGINLLGQCQEGISEEGNCWIGQSVGGSFMTDPILRVLDCPSLDLTHPITSIRSHHTTHSCLSPTHTKLEDIGGKM